MTTTCGDGRRTTVSIVSAGATGMRVGRSAGRPGEKPSATGHGCSKLNGGSRRESPGGPWDAIRSSGALLSAHSRDEDGEDLRVLLSVPDGHSPSDRQTAPLGYPQ
jgi:hypothetical protein